MRYRRPASEIADASTNYLRLMFASQDWVNRRVDSFEFISTRRYRQHTSIDFDWPDPAPALPDHGHSAHALPLFQVSKTPLMGFDIKDDAGRDVPILTASQTRTLSAVGLLALAGQILSSTSPTPSLLNSLSASRSHLSIPPFSALDVELGDVVAHGPRGSVLSDLSALQRLIIQLVVGTSDEGKAALRRIERLAVRDTVKPLWNDWVFRTLARRLAENYYVTAVLADNAALSRRVVCTQYEHLLLPRASRTRGLLADTSATSIGPVEVLTNGILPRAAASLRTVLETVAFWPFTVTQEAHAATDARSYHIEVTPPHGTKIVNTTWFVQPALRDEDDAELGRKDAKRRIAQQIHKEIGPNPVTVRPETQGRDAEHSKAHSVIGTTPVGYSLMFEWQIAPKSTGWLLVATVTSWAATVAQLFVSGAMAGIPTDYPPLAHAAFDWVWSVSGWATGTTGASEINASAKQSRVGFILGLAAIAMTALLRSGEHPLLKRLLIFPRACTLLVTGCLVVSAAPLLLSVDMPASDRVWPTSLYLLLVSLLASVSLSVSWLMAWGFWRRLRRLIAAHWPRWRRVYWKAWLWQRQ